MTSRDGTQYWQMTMVEVAPPRRWPWLIGFMAALAVVAVVGFWLASEWGSTAELRSEAVSAPAGPATSEGTSSNDDPTRLGDGEDGALDGTGSGTGRDVGAVELAAAEESAVADGGPSPSTVDAESAAHDGRPAGYKGDAPFAIFEGGILTLYGKVPSRELSDRYEERFGKIVGPDNVVNKYTVDADFALGEGQTTPVYVTDAVLFDFNSIALKSEYLYLLDYGALMLRQNPQATLTIVTYTDAVGSAETNLEVARLRAQQVLDYWMRNDVNPAQVLSDPRGEDGAADDDDEATAALRRRAEFIITGLLD